MFSSGLRRTLQTLKVMDRLTPARRVATTLTSAWRNVQTARDQTGQLGRTLGIVAKAREARARHASTYHDWPWVSSPINGNYCVNDSVYAGLVASSKETVKCVPVTRDFTVNQKDNRTSDTTDFKCKLTCCNSCTYCKRAAQKERHNSSCKLLSEIKVCERCFCVDQLSFVKPVTSVPTAALDRPVGARLHEFWET